MPKRRRSLPAATSMCRDRRGRGGRERGPLVSAASLGSARAYLMAHPRPGPDAPETPLFAAGRALPSGLRSAAAGHFIGTIDDGPIGGDHSVAQLDYNGGG